ncbi:hypothetical protein CSTERTH_02760 [Thermoclostridium stercorarium subsp. thermolacticum DSM 2910]|nr:hypothetical protein CSTERTH_02760 [Thermoclostridium stercorarium subsp. thermolacticum DSM 2910]
MTKNTNTNSIICLRNTKYMRPFKINLKGRELILFSFSSKMASFTEKRQNRITMQIIKIISVCLDKIL